MENLYIQSSPEQIIEAVKSRGAVHIEEFAAPLLRREVRMDIPGELEHVNNQQNNIAQQFDVAHWKYPYTTPSGIRLLCQSVIDLVTPAAPRWQPNEAMVQRYEPQHKGIEFHRDYYRDKHLVAIATIVGSANFEIYLDGDSQPTRWRVSAGDLVLMRAPGLSGKFDDRPSHCIYPPEQGRRVAIGLRQHVGQQPEELR